MYSLLIGGHRSQPVVLLLLPKSPPDPWSSDSDDDDDEFDLGALVIKCSAPSRRTCLVLAVAQTKESGGKRRRKDLGLASLFAVAITPNAILWINFLIFVDQTTILFLIQQPKFVCECVSVARKCACASVGVSVCDLCCNFFMYIASITKLFIILHKIRDSGRRGCSWVLVKI